MSVGRDGRTSNWGASGETPEQRRNEVGVPRFRPQPVALIPNESRRTCLTYETFFGLIEKPFSVSSDPRFLYKSRSHATALENLLAGIRRRDGLIVLTGDIGMGKTTLCRAALQNLDPRTLSAFVPDPFASREDLLKMLLIDFGVMSIQDLTSGRLKDASRTELSYLLYEFLDTLVPLEAYVVVIIDEAQNMSSPLVEEIRILSDSNGRENQLQVVFVGQLELNAKWKLPEMRQVSQRVSVQCTLEPLDRDAVGEYIAHRLRVAGGSPDRVSFRDDAIDAVFLASGGVPRLVNRICDRSLYQTYLKRAHQVDHAIVEAVTRDVGHLDTPKSPAAAVPPSGLVAAAPQPGLTEVAPQPEAVFTAPSPEPVAAAPFTVPPPVPAAVAPATALAPVAAPIRSALAPAPAPAVVPPAKPVILREPLSDQVDLWLARVDVDARDTSAFPPEGPALVPAPSAALAPVPAAVPAAAPVPDRVPRSDRGAASDDSRSHTYLRRLGRRWVRKLRSAAMWVTVIGALLVGVPQLATVVANMTEPPALPALPAVPARPAAQASVVAAPAEPQPTPAAAADAPGFLIEVALFKTANRAERLVQELTRDGFAAYQRPLNLGARGPHQQVLIGRYRTRAEAEMGLSRLRARQGHDDARIAQSQIPDH